MALFCDHTTDVDSKSAIPMRAQTSVVASQLTSSYTNRRALFSHPVLVSLSWMQQKFFLALSNRSLGRGYRFHTTKTKMIRAGADFTFSPSTHDIARTILICAQKRSAALHALFLGWFGRVEGRVRTLGIACDCTCRRKLLVVIRSIPIAGPLPNVSCHVIQAIAIRRKLLDRRDPHIAVFPTIGFRKMALECVGHPFAVRPERRTPRKRLARKSAPGRRLPLGLSGQALSRPVRIGERILVCDVNNGILSPSFQIADRSFWMSPVRPFDVRPPLQIIVERNLVLRRRENDGARNQVLRRSSRIIFSPRLSLRDRDISGCSDEFGELIIGDVGSVHPEAIDINPMNRTGIGSAVHRCSIFSRRI